MENGSYAQEAMLLQTVLDNTASSIMLLKPVRGADGQIRDFEYLYTNLQTLRSVDADSLAGKYMTHQFPELKNSPLLNSYARVAETGENFQDIVDLKPYGFPVYAQVYATKVNELLLVTYFDISERKRAELEILRLKDEITQRAEGKYRNLFNTMQEGYCLIEIMFDEKGKAWNFRYLEVNPAFAKHTGIEIEYNKTVRDYAPGVSLSFIGIYAEVARTGIPAELTYFAETRQRWFELRATRFGNTEKNQVAILFNDVSDRKIAEIELRKSEEKYRAVFENMIEACCIFEMIYDDLGKPVDWKILEANDGYERQSGLKGVAGKLASEVMPGTERYWIETFDRVVKTGVAEQIERWHQPTERWIHSSTARVGGSGSRRLASIFYDVTERKQREEYQQFLIKFSDALRAEPGTDAIAGRALGMLAEHLGLDRCYVGITLLAENKGIFPYQFGNDRVKPMPEKGVSLSDFPEALRKTFGETLVITDFQNTEGITETEKRNFAALGFGALVVANVRKEERNPYWSINAVSATPRNWTATEIQLVEEATERTWAAMERAKAESDIKAARYYAESTLRTSPVPLLVLESDLTVVTGNEAFYETFQTSQARTQGRHLYELGDGQWNIPRLRQLLEDILPRHTTFNGYEVTHSFERIGTRTMLLNARQMANDPGAPDRIVLVIEDITELKRTEQALRDLNENLEQIVQQRTEQLNKLTILQEKQRLNAILLGQEQERARIGEGIHNGVAQLLFAAQSRLQLLNPADNEKEILTDAITILNDAIRDARNISFELMPPVLKDYGLSVAIEHFIQRIFSGRMIVKFNAGIKERLPEFRDQYIQDRTGNSKQYPQTFLCH